jgi:RecG-like helicase
MATELKDVKNDITKSKKKKQFTPTIVPMYPIMNTIREMKYDSWFRKYLPELKYIYKFLHEYPAYHNIRLCDKVTFQDFAEFIYCNSGRHIYKY